MNYIKYIKIDIKKMKKGEPRVSAFIKCVQWEKYNEQFRNKGIRNTAECSLRFFFFNC